MTGLTDDSDVEHVAEGCAPASVSEETEVTIPRLSAEVFAIPLAGERYIIYAPLRRAALVANRAAVNFLADLDRGVFNDTADPGGSLVDLLRRLEILDGGPEQPPIETFSGAPMPTTVTLLLTTTCNLRCTYCYASAGDTTPRSMTMETARRGIDFVCRNALDVGARSVEVDYHGGGEPTANFSVMTGSLEYARRRCRELGLEQPQAHAATNGVLTDTQIDWVIPNLKGLSISFDGLPAAHDAHRRTIRGEGPSERVMHTLDRLDVADFPYGIRVTVTADQIPVLPESIDFICARFRPRHIQVEPAYALGRWKDAPSSETEEFVVAFREAQARATARGKRIFFSAARAGLLTNHFCGVSQDNFALSATGNVTACYEAFSEESPWAKRFFYGRPDPAGDGYLFDMAVLNELRRWAVEHRSFCNGCFARWSCAGDCYFRALSIHGDGEIGGSARCYITREFTKDQIIEKIAAAGGLFWHEDLNCVR